MSDSNTPPLWLQVPEPHDLVRKFGTALDIPAFGGRLEAARELLGLGERSSPTRPFADAGTALWGGNSVPMRV